MAPSPWQPTTPAPAVSTPSGEVALVEGTSFCISTQGGDMVPELPHGLFVLDTRVISGWDLHVDRQPLEPLTVEVTSPFSATFVTRAAQGDGADSELVVLRRRDVGAGMRERVTLVHYGLEAATVTVELRVDADFAGLFEVKERRVHRHGRHHQDGDPRTLIFGHHGPLGTTESTVRLSEPAEVRPGAARWRRTMAPGERWELCVDVVVTRDDTKVEPLFVCGESNRPALPEQRMAAWRARLPTVSTGHPVLAATLRRSGEDLGALRIFDRERPDAPILAAGAPWFMTVFGRDSLLTGYMTLPADPSLTAGVLDTLARLQGRKVDPETEEEPGKILHEVRFGDAYYGSIDATPLFVMLLGEARRWGMGDDFVDRLLPHADRALDWIEDYGDRDGDGYVEYARQSPTGLENQGWKDSWDAIRTADGRLASPPIALCEVQGYVYAAYLARAYIAEAAGDEEALRRWRERARDLRQRFNQDFWLDDQGTYALALDGDKRPVDAVTSNPGHCLWTGIAEPERAALVADRLLAPDSFSGWGVRTLSAGMAAYNPVSYHNGSVWPHDNALVAAGLMRYGFVDHAHRVIEGQLAAAAHFERMPELFAGFSRTEVGIPASYPASCSPQAWAAGSPLLWLRSLLRVDPCVPGGRVWVAPVLPRSIRRLSVQGIALGPHRLDVAVDRDHVDIDAPDTVQVTAAPRPPGSPLLGPGPASP